MNQFEQKSALRHFNLTTILVAVNVVVFVLGTISSANLWPTEATQFHLDYGERGYSIAEKNEWWRLFTGAFLHIDILHLFFNMLLLYVLGRPLEKLLGWFRFLLLYFGALLAGAFGSLLLEEAIRLTIGSSGAVYGLITSALVLNRMFDGSFNVSGWKRLNWRWKQIINNMFDGSPNIWGHMGLLAFALVTTALFWQEVSIGGHLGGLGGGLVISICYWGIYRISKARYTKVLDNPPEDFNRAKTFARFYRREVMVSSAIAALLGALFFLAGLWAAEWATDKLGPEYDTPLVRCVLDNPTGEGLRDCMLRHEDFLLPFR